MKSFIYFLSTLFMLSIQAEIPVELARANLQHNFKCIPESAATTRASSKAYWTVIVYMQADNDLADHAVQDLMEMTQAASTSEINWLVQWDRPEDNITYRLKIENGKQVDVGSLSQEMGIHPAEELVDCVRWASKKYPAKHTGLILWGHGSGAGEEDTTNRSWLAHLLQQEDDKAILFDDSAKTCLKNEELPLVMKNIRNSLGHNLDLIGMDACLMCEVEIADLLVDAADWFVASANFEMGDGWDYYALINKLVGKHGKLSPQEFGAEIVSTYQKFYMTRDPEFTLALVDLNKIDQLKDQLDQLVTQILLCHKADLNLTNEILLYSFEETNKFKNMYADLYRFATSLGLVLNSFVPDLIQEKNKKMLKLLLPLQAKVAELKSCIKSVVPSKVVGQELYSNGGLSIYFPDIWQTYMNAKYAESFFAQTSLWSQLLTINDAKSMPQLARNLKRHTQ